MKSELRIQHELRANEGLGEMPEAKRRINTIDAKSAWFSMQEGRRTEIGSDQLLADFELIGSEDVLVRLRAKNRANPPGVALVSFPLGALIELLSQYVAHAEFKRCNYDEAFLYATTQAKDGYHITESTSIWQVQKLRSFDKFSDELGALEKTMRKLNVLYDEMLELINRYDNLSSRKRVTKDC